MVRSKYPIPPPNNRPQLKRVPSKLNQFRSMASRALRYPLPLPNGDAAGTNFAFGGPDNQYIYMEGAVSGTIWRFKAPYPGLIGPGGGRLPAQR